MLLAPIVWLAWGCLPPSAHRSGGERTDRWSDAETRETSQILADALLASPWLDTWWREHQRPPLLATGRLRNRGSEQIDTTAVLEAVRDRLVLSQRVVFRVALEERAALREGERSTFVGAASAETRPGDEAGADALLRGQLTMQVDGSGGTQSRVYHVDLELVATESNEVLWTGRHSIKLLVHRASVAL